MVIFRS